MVSAMHMVEIIGSLGTLDPVVNRIQDEGLLHIEEIPLSEYGGSQFLHRVNLSDSQAREKASVQELVDILEEAAAFVPEDIRTSFAGSEAYLAAYRKWEAEDIGAITVAARTAHSKARSFQRRRRNLVDDLHALAAYHEAVSELAPLVETHELPRDYEFTGVIMEGKSSARMVFQEQIRKITGNEYRYWEAQTGKKHVSALIGFPKAHAANIRHLILEGGIGQMNVPRYLRDRPFEEALAVLQEDMKGLQEKQRALERQTEDFYSRQTAPLLAMLDVCRDRRSRYDAISLIARTRYTFIIRGWVPSRSYGTFRKSLAEVSDDTVVLRQIRPHNNEKPPVALSNPRPVRAFQPLMSLFPLPQYGTIDPTVFVATMFPPMFGLMLADIGYGILVGLGALLTFWFGRSRPLARKIAFVTAACAGFTLLFGFLFGEFFGELGHHLFGLEPLWQPRFTFTGPDRAKLLLGYMAIAGTIGVVHVLLGLVLGAINSHRTGNRPGMVENLAKIAGIFMLLFFVGRMVNLLPPVFTSLGVAALVVFAALMVFQIIHRPTHGLLLPLEVLGTVGNILSYIRIMAIGLVSVVLAVLANLFGEMIENVVLAVIIAVLVHALNLALGIIDPTIQGLRLHYVEFFSKFYLGGGKPYAPFRKTGGTI